MVNIGTLEERDRKLIVELGCLNRENKALLKHRDKIEIFFKCKKCGKQFSDMIDVLAHFDKSDCEIISSDVNSQSNEPNKKEVDKAKQSSNAIITRGKTTNLSNDSKNGKRKLQNNKVNEVTPDRGTKRRASTPKYLIDYVTAAAPKPKIEAKHASKLPQVVVRDRVVVTIPKCDIVSPPPSAVIKRGRGRPRKSDQTNDDEAIVISASSQTTDDVQEMTEETADIDLDMTCNEETRMVSLLPSMPTRGRGRPKKIPANASQALCHKALCAVTQNSLQTAQTDTDSCHKVQASKPTSAKRGHQSIVDKDQTVESSAVKRLSDLTTVIDKRPQKMTSVQLSTMTTDNPTKMTSGPPTTMTSGQPTTMTSDGPTTVALDNSTTITTDNSPAITPDDPIEMTAANPTTMTTVENGHEKSFKVTGVEHNYNMTNKDNDAVNNTSPVLSAGEKNIAEGPTTAFEDPLVTIEGEIQEDREFPCPKCEMNTFTSEEELKLHLRCHSENGFYCLSCGYSCKNWNRLFEHMLNHKGIREKISKTEMGKKYVGEFACPLCTEKFTVRHHLRNHINKTHNPPRKEDAEKTTGKKKKKSKQWKMKGATGEFYRCPRCPRRYLSSVKELVFHLKFHIEEDRDVFECSQCGYRTSNSWSRMLEHIAMHPSMTDSIKGTDMWQKNFSTHTCKQCGKKYTSLFSLKTHRSKVHQKKDKVCDVCGKTLHKTDNKTFKRHVERCRNISSGAILKCSECSYKTRIAADLKKHSRIHQGMGFQCEFCPSQFSTKTQYLQHIKIHSKNRQRFMCEYCGAEFLFTKSLENHIARLHTETSDTYQCSLCEYQAKVKSDLTRHCKYVHEGKYKCSKCQYTTNVETSLALHMKYHTSNRTYACKVPNCFYRGTTSKQLSDHKSAVHNSRKVFQCPVCPRSYKKQIHLKRHMVFHTDDHPYQCSLCLERFQCHARYYRHMREHRDKGEHVEEFTTVENIVAEVVQDNGQSHDLLRLIRTNHEASSAIENLKLEVASDEYEAVITLSNELYQQAEGDVLTASDADGQSLVITQAQPPEGSTEILTAAEIPAVSNEILTHQEGLLTETEAAAVQQELLSEQSELDLTDASLQTYTLIVDEHMDGSIIELPASHHMLPPDSKIVQVSAPSDDPGHKPHYAIVVLDQNDT